jgi:radical SAM superfamily enzyme YgiQ (UPF0313 family)
MSAQAIDALFIPYYYDMDRWHNDEGPAGSNGNGHEGSGDGTAKKKTFSRKDRMAREAVSIDGRPYDLSRFLSWARYGSTVEFERYDSYSLTLLGGTYYLSFLRQHGYNVQVANSVHRQALQSLKERYQPRFVLLSTTLVLENLILHDAVTQIRQAWPDAVLIVGGLFLVELQKTNTPEKFSSILNAYGADAYVVSPRGEHALMEILSRGTREKLFSGPPIPATFMRKGNTIVPPETLLDPSTKMEETYIHWKDGVPHEHLYHTVHTRTARSCAFMCAFCNFPINQGALTLMPLDAFEKELDELKACGRVRSLIFTDDTFNVPQKRFKELCRLLARYEFEWYSFFRPQFADKETVSLMKAAHCRGVFLGIESADNQILKNMNKAATVAGFQRGIAELEKNDIRMHANFIVGFPGETEESARKLVGFLDNTSIEFFTMAPFYYVPSTPIHERREEFGLSGKFETWKHNTMTSTEAFALTASMIDAPKYAVHAPELAANNFWTEIMFYSNGYNASETQEVFKTYNRYVGHDLNSAEFGKSDEFRRLRSILDRHDMPRPVNF